VIDESKFSAAHRAFMINMQREGGGIPFTSFDHPLLYKNEIAYKHRAYDEGQKAISFKNWDGWIKKTGRILEATKNACAPSISSNLLVHQYGAKGNSYGALYLVETDIEIKEMEKELYNFLLGGDSNLYSLGARFDRFAGYLRERRLGCKWTFVAYLCFLLDPMLYFPVLPGRFQKLMDYYGLNEDFSGKVEWKRYLSLLNMAEQLKDNLTIYGQLNAIQIQSYIYVVSGLFDQFQSDEFQIDSIDFKMELENRQKRSAEKERIGLMGEQFILESERKRLIEAKRADLSTLVKLVSAESSSIGYDILSFNVSGDPIHIEVKTTTREKELDNGFWLPEVERTCAKNDLAWTVYRVWAISSNPFFENIGNIIQDNKNWNVNPSSWFVTYNGSEN
jgi:hypothetical protein